MPHCWRATSLHLLNTLESHPYWKKLPLIQMFSLIIGRFLNCRTCQRWSRELHSQTLQDYLDDFNFFPTMQSAYRRGYGTEMALLRVQGDIVSALDKRKEALLVLLDFSSAFDTINHQLLIDRLYNRYGITGTPLRWFKSYLQDRTQFVAIEECVSASTGVLCGVPQGSVAGPVLFSLYSAPIQDIIAAHCLQCAVYADDVQIYLSFNPKDRNQAIKRINACVNHIKSWCVANKLVLNECKTELLHFTSKFSTVSHSPAITIGDPAIHPANYAHNLGIVMDASLNMTLHVNSMCKSALLGIRKIRQIRKYLDESSTVKLVHAFVTSRLDACNSLLYMVCQKMRLLNCSVCRIPLLVWFYVYLAAHITTFAWASLVAGQEKSHLQNSADYI